MKKMIKIIGVIVSIALVLGSFVSCGSRVVPNVYNAGMSKLEVHATYNGIEEVFRGTVSGTSITIDLPGNIDSWDDISLFLDLNRLEFSAQLNGTGTAYNYTNAQNITGVSISNISSILVKGYTDSDYNTYQDQTYSVTITKKLYVVYNKNYGNGGTLQLSTKKLYGNGEKISLPSEGIERQYYRQFGWSTSSTAATPEYNLGSEINVTSSMVNTGVLDFYATWSTYHIGQLLTNVTDVDGNSQTGYVAYICGNNDTVKANSSKPSTNWTYLIVSKYGATRLTGKTWQEANSGFSGNAYLPSKTEMNVITDNLLCELCIWQIFSNASTPSSSWDDFWTATEYNADTTKAYVASVKLSDYEVAFQTLSKTTFTLSAIGVSYIN